MAFYKRSDTPLAVNFFFSSLYFAPSPLSELLEQDQLRVNFVIVFICNCCNY